MQIILLLVIVGVVVWAVRSNQQARDRSPGARGHTPTELGRSTASIDEVLQAASMAISTLPKRRLSAGTSGTLIVEHLYWAWWRILIAIVLFPIGLLALAGRDSRIATVAARRDKKDITHVSLSGAADQALVAAVQRSIPARAARPQHVRDGSGRSDESDVNAGPS